MATINDLMNSIAQMEGFNTSGTIAQRNNNPGNLRYAPNQIGTDNTISGKFATFATPADGWAALQYQVELDASRGKTLRDFIYGYAPPSENNTSGYLNSLVSDLGVSADSQLSDLGGSNVDIVGNADASSGLFSDISNSAAGLDWGVVGLVVVGVMLMVQD